MKRRLVMSWLLLALQGGCGEPDPILVAVVGPWAARDSSDLVRGAVLAAGEANGAGGINGRRLLIEIRRDGYGERRLDGPATLAEELVQRDEVIAIVGHANSDALAAAAPVYGARIPVLAPIDVQQAADSTRAIFGLIDEDGVSMALARAVHARRWRRVAVIFENSTGGRYAADRFLAHYSGTTVSIDPIYIMPPEEYEPFLEFYRAQQLDAVVAFTSAFSGYALLTAMDDAELGIGAGGGHPWISLVERNDTRELVDEALIALPFRVDTTRPDARRFVDRYRSRHGREPGIDAVLGYDAVRAIVQGARTRGPTRAGVISALRQNGHTGVSGPVHFDAFGHRVDQTPHVVVIAHDDRP